MPRQLQFDREAVLESAMTVFWRYGFHDTGIEDLVSATGIRRASIYHTFGNKQQFFITVLERYTDICIQNLSAAVVDANSPVDGISSILNMYKETVLGNERGCLLFNTALEMSSFDEDIRQVVWRGLNRIEQLLLLLVDRGKDAGQITRSAKSSTLARAISAAMQSLSIMGCVGASNEILDDICQSAMLLFRNESTQKASNTIQ